jgi:hypothetical protein
MSIRRIPRNQESQNSCSTADMQLIMMCPFGLSEDSIETQFATKVHL